MAWDTGDSFMPIYLLIASVANALFVYRSFRDLWSRRKGEEASADVALSALAFSQFTWVLPCCVQCFLVFADATPRGDWQPTKEGGTGCDVQGFYSVFASISSQLLAMLISGLTYAATSSSSVDSKTAWLTAVGSIFVTVILSCIPFYGIGEFRYSGEGFCYFDWLDETHVAVLETVAFVSVIFTSLLFAMSIRNLSSFDAAASFGVSNERVRLWIVVMIVNHVVAWGLWIPAGFLGLGYDDMSDFPTGYMITGAILGHAQALVGPLIYGWVWAGWMHHAHDRRGKTGDVRLAEKKEGGMLLV